jgi:RNA polymerase sigma-70 factor (ECF subfamily)
VQTSLALTLADFGSFPIAPSNEAGADAGVRPTPLQPATTTAATVAAVYDAHHGELFGFALRTTRDSDAAEDLLHEAFVRLIVEIDAGRTPDNVRAWLYRVVGNLAVSRGRRASVAQRHIPTLVDRSVDEGPEPAVLDLERSSDLERALAELPADARTALLMAAQGFDGAEIATAIGRTPLATRSLMCRARLQLRQRLAATEWVR